MRSALKKILFDDNTLSDLPSGYLLWYRPDGIIAGISNQYGIADGAGDVSQISDLSGNGRHAIQLTGLKQPSLVSSVVGTNLRKVIRFLGSSSESLGITTGLDLFKNISGYTIYAIAKTTAAANQTYFYFSTGTADVSRVFLGATSGNLHQTGGRRLDTNSIQSITGASSSASYKVVASVFYFANSDLFLYENNVLVNSSTAFQTDGSTSNTDSQFASIGSSNLSNYFTGDIADIIVYPTIHSAADQTRVYQSLITYYGL